ncbi:methionyl-tRNA formyltransferase [uncultured Jatrophihabitans sp.]|uniref:methionyl-tRNA formyltransferase n=1 Tax=uncultured Jatrophihabitans sp. TaxID=1610747 RepID=UPI0035CA77EC
MRLVFAGTPDAAVPTLRTLLDAPQHDVVAVVTRPPARAGRGRKASTSPVAALAADAGLPTLTPQRAGDPDFLAQLAQLAPHCCPVVAYGALLPPAALAVPVHGWVNLHFSLLPAWRGAAPVQHALLHGDDVTGASTFRIEAGLDTGPVFGVVTEAVRAEDTSGDLLSRLSDSGAGLMLATLDGIETGALVARPQAADGVSFAPKVSTEDAHLDWTTPARHVERVSRACTPTPGPWTTLRGERLKLGPVRLTGANDLAPGEVAVLKRAVRVGTASSDVELTTVQPPGRRAFPAPDWARGARLQPGERLG